MHMSMITHGWMGGAQWQNKKKHKQIATQEIDNRLRKKNYHKDGQILVSP